MDILFLIGRILFSSLFIMSGINHIAKLNDMTAYAESKGVPSARLAVIVSGIVILLGGLGVLLGFQLALSAILLFLFLIVTSFMMHNFWAIDDPQMKMVEMTQFMKNMVIAGGCLIILWLTQQGVTIPFSLGG